jgi:hypothetical protein
MHVLTASRDTASRGTASRDTEYRAALAAIALRVPVGWPVA